jgi:hypothetical protein
MIKPSMRNTNISKDVPGPKLLRSYDQENDMKEMKDGMGGDLFHDDHPTNTISKHPLSELHYGDHESPLSASGLQGVVETSPMGSDHPDHKPVIAKGMTKDQAHHGGAGGPVKADSKSVKEVSPRNPKGAGRSVAKELMYSAKRKAE